MASERNRSPPPSIEPCQDRSTSPTMMRVKGVPRSCGITIFPPARLYRVWEAKGKDQETCESIAVRHLC